MFYCQVPYSKVGERIIGTKSNGTSENKKNKGGHINTITKEKVGGMLNALAMRELTI